MCRHCIRCTPHCRRTCRHHNPHMSWRVTRLGSPWICRPGRNCIPRRLALMNIFRHYIGCISPNHLSNICRQYNLDIHFRPIPRCKGLLNNHTRGFARLIAQRICRPCRVHMILYRPPSFYKTCRRCKTHTSLEYYTRHLPHCRYPSGLFHIDLYKYTFL